ncbi:MAG TPA: cytochrome c [Terracidiphilus sp.]|nr:cytochrome c [Terracidiphilus sp.]
MSKTIRSQAVLVLALSLAGAMSFAQSGEATYKAKCQSCHGAAGIPNAGIAKLMGVKPVTDPAVKSATEAQMIKATEDGMGKMQPFKGKLTDAQIKDAVTYFRSFIK